MFGWLRRAPPPPTEQQVRMSQALAEYPLYAPPDWDPAAPLEARQAASLQYREYFLASTQTRLGALRAFLEKFDVALDLTDAGLMAVSTWLPQWGDMLIGEFNDWHIYNRLEVPWTGRLRGLNVMFDLGTYHAECLWARRKKLEWLIGRGLDVHGNPIAPHMIQGLPGGKLFDPIHSMRLDCWSIRQAKIRKQKRLPFSDNPGALKSDRFYRQVMSQAPPGRRSRKLDAPERSI